LLAPGNAVKCFCALVSNKCCRKSLQTKYLCIILKTCRIASLGFATKLLTGLYLYLHISRRANLPNREEILPAPITSSTVVLRVMGNKPFLCSKSKIGPSVTLYSLDRSLQNLAPLIVSTTPTAMPILVEFGWVGNSPPLGEI